MIYQQIVHGNNALLVDYRTAYEFPKPASDVKDAQVPNVEAIRGGLSFRGLIKQRAGCIVSINLTWGWV